jgi:hypothetical protein
MIYRPTPITEAKGLVIDAAIRERIMASRMAMRTSNQNLATAGTSNVVLLETPAFCRGGGRLEAVERRIRELRDLLDSGASNLSK